ncbi:MAG TPA: GNAT family N-acetyltransferase [Bryobacteraceae bacterium]|jgi:ribosomal protein S18 acetylase RimI-like enzyme|nr:GNAT family N-acetyltransferase [Bryobacteraceae bacterium]
MIIRPAAPDDIPRLSELLGLLFAQEADFTPDPQRQARGLSLVIANAEIGRVFCAAHSETVIGMVSILFTVSTAEGGRAAWLEDMIVHPEWRGRGVGQQLLAHAISQAQAAGCSRVTLLTDQTNEDAMRFYRRAGFERSQMTPFRLRL